MNNQRHFKMRICAAISLTLVLGSLCGCTYTLPHQVVASNTPLFTPNSYKILGPAAGESCESHFMGILVSSPSRLQAAIDNALQKSGGDAIIEMTSDLQVSNSFFINTQCTLVNGLAVKIIESGQEAK